MFEIELDQVVKVVDNDGVELGQTTQNTLMSQSKFLGIEPPVLDNGTINLEQIEQIVLAFNEKMTPLFKALNDWVAGIVPIINSSLSSIVEWANKFEQYRIENKPYISKQRLNRTPRYR